MVFPSNLPDDQALHGSGHRRQDPHAQAERDPRGPVAAPASQMHPRGGMG